MVWALYDFSQNNWDSGTSTEGRSIGSVRDQSAPTGGRIILFICINVIFPVLCSIILDRSQTKVLREEMEENG